MGRLTSFSWVLVGALLSLSLPSSAQEGGPGAPDDVRLAALLDTAKGTPEGPWCIGQGETSPQRKQKLRPVPEAWLQETRRLRKHVFQIDQCILRSSGVRGPGGAGRALAVWVDDLVLPFVGGVAVPVMTTGGGLASTAVFMIFTRRGGQWLHTGTIWYWQS